MPVNFIEDEAPETAVHFIEDEAQPTVPAAETLKEPPQYEPETQVSPYSPVGRSSPTAFVAPQMPVGSVTTEDLFKPPFGSIPSLPTTKELPAGAVEKIKAFTTPITAAAGLIGGPESAVALQRNLANLPIEAANFLMSPVGLATLPAGLVAPTVTQGVFTADMLKNLYQQGMQTYENWDKMTGPERSAAIGDMLKTGTLTAGVAHGFGKGAKAQFEQFAKKREAAKAAAETTAGPGPFPEATSEDIATVEQRAEVFRRPEEAAAAIADLHKTIRKQEMDSLRREAHTILQRQKKAAPVEVPATEAEPYETVLQTVRNANARTIAQIQSLFPKSEMNREQARVIRNAAFGGPPEQVVKPKPQATIQDVLGAVEKGDPEAAAQAARNLTSQTTEQRKLQQEILKQAEKPTESTPVPTPEEQAALKQELADLQEEPTTQPKPAEEVIPSAKEVQRQEAVKSEPIPPATPGTATPQGEAAAPLPPKPSPVEVAGDVQPQVPSERLLIRPRTDGMVSLEDAKGSRIGTFKTVEDAAETAKELGYEISPGSPLKPKPTQAQLEYQAAKDAAQAAFEKLGTAERGAYDKSKRKGMTKAQLARLSEFDKLSEAEKAAKAKAKQPAAQAQPKATSDPQVEPRIGPGAAAPVDVGTKAQIEQLGDAFANKAPVKQRVEAFLRDAFTLGDTAAKTKDALARGLNALKSSGEAIWNTISKYENPDQLMRYKGMLSAELEKRGWRTREFAKLAKSAVPEKRRRAAISKWIDAGGDSSTLLNGESAAPARYKQAYRDAINLSPEDKNHAQNISNYFESRLQEAIDAGVLQHGLEDYIHRIYERKPDLRDKAVAYVQSGVLSRNPALAKKRFFQFDWEAEAAGLHPVQDFIPRIAQYESSLSRAIAARKFIKQLTEMNAPDGRPVISVKGVGFPIEDPVSGAREATLIKPKFDPKRQTDPADLANYRADYVNREYNALSKWKWVGTDSGGKPILLQGDVAIHPDYVGRIDALLEPSRIRYGRYAKYGKAALDVSSTVKQTMLDLSMFHQVQIALHAMEHRVMPWKIVDKIDFENPHVEGLLQGGVTLGGEYRSGHYGEGLIGSSLTRKIPLLGEVMEGYHSWLFQDFIPRVKMTMALHALERNRAAYAKPLAEGKLTEAGLYQMTAKQANAAFGELNYTMLERSKTTQDMARLIMLAPDFLEARAKFVGQAFTRSGQEQRVALLLGALTMYAMARIANKVLNDQYHLEPENMFSIVHNGRSYSMRTVQGDILHLLDKPIGFWLNRLNPVYTRPALQIVAGRDQFGRKRSLAETAWDSVANVVPISLRSSRERKLWESMMNAFGGNVRRWNDVEKARTLADNWNKSQGKTAYTEVIYDSEKDPLRPLKIALSYGDEAVAAKEIQRVLEGRVKSTAELEKYFKWYSAAPFTGSKATDAKWYASLSEDQRKTVDGARAHRRNMGALYHKALAIYYANARKKP